MALFNYILLEKAIKFIHKFIHLFFQLENDNMKTQQYDPDLKDFQKYLYKTYYIN